MLLSHHLVTFDGEHDQDQSQNERSVLQPRRTMAVLVLRVRDPCPTLPPTVASGLYLLALPLLPGSPRPSASHPCLEMAKDVMVDQTRGCPAAPARGGV